MPRFAFLCCAAVLVGCTKSEDRAADDQTAMDTAAAAPETPAPSATISLADVAGKWKVRSTDEDGGNVLETGLVATADTSGWTMTSPNRKPIPVRVVAVAGDSIVTEAGPFESFIRKGVQVTTRTVNRLQDGKLVGTIEARYATKAGDRAPFVSQPVWIKEALQDAPDRVAKQADGSDQQQRASEWLPEHGDERAARARHPSAEPGGDLQRQHPDDYVQHALDEEAGAGQKLQRVH
jgi:hypothetical protein